ncbi:4-hydroxythreonine-4-phosphate dehydrogenase PdxA [Sphingomonas humi]|uniref:4-hydroxythreonine-4-phosphate dehydrogenase n=1 Tax=Sphingomonas humi TaxID=335630 RepID=A0ABP7S608_9SPHN
MSLPPLLLSVSLGDPAGIGPEVVAKTWDSRRALSVPPFVAVGDPRSLSEVWDGPIAVLSNPAEAVDAFDHGLPLLAVPAAAASLPGQPTTAGAHCSLDSLELAVGLARSGTCAGVVTGPVAKHQLYAIGFNHPGQTEFVAERCGVSPGNVAMMLAGPTLRTVPVTTHMPLRDVADVLSAPLIEARARATLRGLQRNFGIAHPRLAIAGFNPHAGENGALGREEQEVIEPAIATLREEGWDVTGPYPADTMFHASARARYDAALCMYHDQALIPLKALHFEEGVNLTLGLPIVRAAPDHGTAFDIAGQDRADPRAMAAAIRMAASCARHRALHG